MTSSHPLLNTRSRWYYPFHWFILLAVGLLVYGQTLGFGFVFDDYEFIVNDAYIKSFQRLGQIWEYFPMTRVVGMYSFAFNYAVNQLHPAGYHLFNLLVHLASTVLVWGITAMLFRTAGYQPRHWLQQELPFITALLFLVHPCQIQAVTYISQRFESMAAMFYLGVFYCYVRARTCTPLPESIVFFCAAALGTVAGIFTKETVITVPAMILVYEWIFRKPAAKPMGKMAIAGIVAACVVFFLVFERLVDTKLSGMLVQLIPSESHDGDIISTPAYFLTQMRVFLTFLRLLILPIHQNLDYDYPLSTGFFSPPLTAVGACVMAGMVWSVFYLRRRLPLVALGIAWVLVTFSINMAPRSNVIFEHKLYLISFGAFLALTAWLSSWGRGYTMAAKVLACVLAALAVLTILRNQVWKSELLLWEDIARKSPAKSRVQVNLGRVYGDAGQLPESLACFTKAIALDPQNAYAFANRGVIQERLGHPQEALRDFDQALRRDPKYHSVHLKRAWTYKNLGNEEAALADLAQAIAMEPNFPAAYIQRAMLYMGRQRLDDAFADVQQALQLAPYDFDALIIRGAIYHLRGDYPRALKDFTQAREVNPANPLVYKNLGYCLLKLGRTADADDMFRKLASFGVHQ